ncbi:hypothetical protein [Enterovibrio sp. 27052020O]|uniref:hypothetical protein n=1 Tax=Enterovibrio sp. 27052020O TaxID=3241166 RepID=UPI003890E367
METLNLIKTATLSSALLLVAGCGEYGDFSTEQICRASLAAIKGKSPTIVVVDKKTIEAETELDVFHISYKRPDDGKKWSYRCKVDKKRAVWAQGDGRWRDQAQDPTVRFNIDGDDIQILETFPDGSAATSVNFNISMLGGKS